MSGSINGVTVVGPDTNSDSLTVKVTELEVTVVASALDKTQRNCSDGLVGNDVAGVVYDAEFAPLRLVQLPPLSVDFCHWYPIESLVIAAVILKVAVCPSITDVSTGC